MLLINQDRDKSVMFDPAEDNVTAKPVYLNRDFIGINLIFDGVLLGTFDTLEEALTERNIIMNFPFDIHYVRGYSEWE